MSSIFLGIDIGGTTVKAAAIVDRQVLWTARSEPYSRPTADQVIAAVRQACANAPAKVSGVGLCVPGLLNEAKERVTYAANLPGLLSLSLSELIVHGTESALQPVVVNDANATAYDIYASCGTKGRLLVLTIGGGVGASVLDDGKPLFVDGESPGHVGQIDVLLEDEPVIAPDGGRGGLEGYLGAAALAARYGADPASKIRPGDAAFRALVRVIRICQAIYRPHHVCLAGGTGIRLGHLVDDLRLHVCENLTAVARDGWTLFTGDSDYHAARGAARIAESGDWSRS